MENEFKQREKLAQMAVYISQRIAWIACVRRCRRTSHARTTMVDLEKRTRTLRDGSGISDPTQQIKKSVPATPRRPYFNNSIPADARSGAKDYDKATNILSDYYKLKKNAPSQETKPNHSREQGTRNKRSKID